MLLLLLLLLLLHYILPVTAASVDVVAFAALNLINTIISLNLSSFIRTICRSFSVGVLMTRKKINRHLLFFTMLKIK